MNGFQLKVSTQAMRSKAAAAAGKIKEMKSTVEEARRLVSGTQGYWLGESAEKRRSEYNKDHQKLEEMLKRLGEYPDDLLAMAGIYEQAEQNNTSAAGALLTDVIR